MNRRDTLAALLLALGAVPLAARPQPRGRLYKIGVLDTVPAAQNAANMDAFRSALRDLGYVEGQNLEIVYRSFDGQSARLPDLASELAGLKVDLILTRGTPAALAAKNVRPTVA